ncbi:predicted protein [Nematostella vectensis]|uniref:Uncharacterized protein n=1 Tax=Nematostella vectensis TaxID=45351 RepID=A7S0F1_NEMVE|nr:predicted protein [Nematostella vectensis]|eukprot:XP_001634888.1 predicted protein [Nematostella vectensis]
MAYKAQGIRTLGIAQIVIGSLMAIFGISSVAAVSNWTSIAGFGIWIGIWVVITGVLGYIGAKDNNTPNNCLGKPTASCVPTSSAWTTWTTGSGHCSGAKRSCYRNHNHTDLPKPSTRHHPATGSGSGILVSRSSTGLPPGVLSGLPPGEQSGLPPATALPD